MMLRLCVMISMVIFSCLERFFISSRICVWMVMLSVVVGLLVRMSDGLYVSAMVIIMCWCMLLLKWCGY